MIVDAKTHWIMIFDKRTENQYAHGVNFDLNEDIMPTISVNEFRDNLRHYVDEATKNHEVLNVSRRNGKDFIVMSHEDWQSIEETLYVLQDNSLMQQISSSLQTHLKNQGYRPTQEELDEINRF